MGFVVNFDGFVINLENNTITVLICDYIIQQKIFRLRDKIKEDIPFDFNSNICYIYLNDNIQIYKNHRRENLKNIVDYSLQNKIPIKFYSKLEKNNKWVFNVSKMFIN